MKYRLKKDLPDLEAGEIFDDTDSFGHETSSMFDSRGAYRFEKDDIKHFDEWFEDLGSQKWTRKQIKQIEFGEHKSVYVVVRFIKSQNYIGYDTELGDVVASNEPGEIKRIWFKANESKFWRQKDYDVLNQMIRDGYIEIEDNPNIVWEDEKCD